MVIHKHGETAAAINDNVVYAHPFPIDSLIGVIAAEAAAPNSHRKRLFAAVAVADCPGHKSTIKALSTCDVAVIDHPVTKSRITGAARLTFRPITQP